MEGAIHQSTANTMPETQVDALMSQVADEHGLEFESNLPSAGTKKMEQKQEQKEAPKEPAKVVQLSEEESLEDRLRRLQGL